MSKDYLHHNRHKYDFQKRKLCKLSSSHCWLIHLISFPCILSQRLKNINTLLESTVVIQILEIPHKQKSAGASQGSFSFLTKIKETASPPTSPYLSHLCILGWKKMHCLIVRQPLCALERTTRIVAEGRCSWQQRASEPWQAVVSSDLFSETNKTLLVSDTVTRFSVICIWKDS